LRKTGIPAQVDEASFELRSDVRRFLALEKQHTQGSHSRPSSAAIKDGLYELDVENPQPLCSFKNPPEAAFGDDGG
jgi:hypothetical protein